MAAVKEFITYHLAFDLDYMDKMCKDLRPKFSLAYLT